MPPSRVPPAFGDFPFVDAGFRAPLRALPSTEGIACLRML